MPSWLRFAFAQKFWFDIPIQRIARQALPIPKPDDESSLCLISTISISARS